MEASDGLFVLGQVVDELIASADLANGSDLSLPTPCDDWPLGELLDHVVGGNRFTVSILEGASAEDAIAFAIGSFGDDRDHFADLVTSSRQLVDAFQAPGVLSKLYHHVVGPLRGDQVLRLRLHDLIVHGWDLDETLRPPASLSPALEAWGTAELADEASVTVRHFGLAVTPADAPYLQRMGRL